ncbi:MAG: sugar ABC transporter permease [Acidimicrobiales bacterium]|nr:sugar ABC transporter permease [Acidimicrobiales bacterium]HRW39080.1 sugar ABC transporter permease [Aquihabitans sp.]
MTAIDLPPERVAARRRNRARKRREALLAYLLISPALVVFAVFVFYPFAKNIWLGLYRTPPFPGLPKRYAAYDQYARVLTSPEFRGSLRTTFLFVAMTVPTGLLLGLLMAVLAHQKLRGIAIYRTIFSSTVATSIAVASVIFFTLLNPQVGLLTYLLGREGEPSVLDDPRWALVAVAGVTIWQNLGLSFILMSAGLQGVPDDLLEAAEIDGAGAWGRFRHVVVPLLSPTIFFATIVGSILAFQAFGQIDLLTQGGPLRKTNVIVYAMYDAVFRQNNEGKAAVLSVALFAITLVLTLIQLRLLERRVTYER